MKLLEQLIKFGGIGGFLAIISICIYYITLDILHLPVYPIYIVVYCIAVWVSYMLNSKYTFKEERSQKGLAKYYLVYAVGLGVGLGLIFLGKTHTDLSDFWVTVASIIPRTLFVFVLSKFFVFSAGS
jgi:putative flippase GtrA